MKVLGLFDIDEQIKVNDLQEVTSQAIYQGSSFHSKGLFSEDIFGQTEEERMHRCGYIKLPIHIMNSNISKTIISRGGGIIKKMMYGETRCNIVDGVLIPHPDGKYCGLKDLYDIWDKIDIEKTLTSKVKNNITILTKTPRRLIFTDKVLVLPPSYRKIGTNNGKVVKSELNTMYMRLLGMKSVTAHTTSSSVYTLYNKFQEAADDIFLYVKNYVSGKHGFFQTHLLSKTPVFPARNVISAPKYDKNECPIGVFQTGYPLLSCASMFEPFVRFQMKQILSPNGLMSIHPNPREINQDEITNVYDEKMIRDLFTIYIKNPGSRFMKLYLDAEQTKPIIFNGFNVDKNEAVSREFTLTDLIYISCKRAITDPGRMAYFVRYPIGDYMGAFFTKIHILSTNKTVKMDFGGERYDYYPDINPNLPHSIVARLFAETVTPSNSRLKAVGGDYDGDTIKSVGIWSDEANKEAEELMYSKIYNINPSCSSIYVIETECVAGLYNLTEKVSTEPKDINKTKIALQRILDADLSSINKTFLNNMFAGYHDKVENRFVDRPFDPTDKITITPKEYKYVTKPTETTLGIILFNRYILERTGIIDKLGYWNDVITDKGLGKLNVVINNLVLKDIIDTRILGEYIDSRDRLGFWCSSILASALTAGIVRPMKDVETRKNQLFEERKDELNSDNPVVQVMASNEIENELIGMIKENLKNDKGYDYYASGIGNFNNNYKNINVMRGAVFNNATNKYDIVKASFMDGITQNDIPAFANSVVAAAYPSAVGTAEAGAMAKELMAALQSAHLNPDRNSDCGTKSTIPFTITKKNKQYVLYRNIEVNGKPYELNLDNIDKFVDKQVRLYSPQCCVNESICGKCAGSSFHNLGVTNVGLLMTQITQKLLNLKLKSKHDLSQSANIIPLSTTFLHQNQYCYIDSGILKNKITMKLFIPRLLEEMSAFVHESTHMTCFAFFPVKFYDNSGNEVLSTFMTIPAMMIFNLYEEAQEDPEYYIISYEPNSSICDMRASQSVANVDFFLNQIFLRSRTPQIHYNMMAEMTFRCLEINNKDLTGPSLCYELLARTLCVDDNGKTFAYTYGKNQNVDQMSYTKLPVRKAVHNSNVLSGILFQDAVGALSTSLANTLNGVESTETPLEKLIKI